MIIEHKLALSRKPIRFFYEGMFLQLFNQSLYIAQTQFNLPVKPITKTIKKLNQIIVVSGLPSYRLGDYFPQATSTSFGYEFNGEFDLSGYFAWYRYHCQQCLKQANKPILTSQQLLFLATWQEDKFPSSVDKAFIRQLKNQFTD